jgi:hypothetical protein
MSPMELSSGVVALTVLFLMLSLGDEVGDDSVPLGVYSVPGLDVNQLWGWGWAQTVARWLMRQLSVGSRADARRIAALVLVNVLSTLVLVLAGLYEYNNQLLALALRHLYTSAVLAIALGGTIIKYSRPGADFSYGYCRFETLHQRLAAGLHHPLRAHARRGLSAGIGRRRRECGAADVGRGGGVGAAGVWGRGRLDAAARGFRCSACWREGRAGVAPWRRG